MTRFSRALSALALALTTLFVLAKDAVAEGSPSLFVFIPTDQKPSTVERALSANLPGIRVTVFGRSRDFMRAVEERSPSAVLALPPNLGELGLTASLHGTRAGLAHEPYVLITINRAIPPTALADKQVGAFGILDRQGMKMLYGKLLGTGSQDVVTVTKYEDLLPLLQFGEATAVVLPKRYARLITDRSELNFIVSPIFGGSIGIASLAINEQRHASEVVRAVEGMDLTCRSYLGVDAWQ